MATPSADHKPLSGRVTSHPAEATSSASPVVSAPRVLHLDCLHQACHHQTGHARAAYRDDAVPNGISIEYAVDSHIFAQCI